MDYSKDTKRKIKDNRDLLRSLLSQGMNKPSGQTMSIEESIQKYNPSVSREEIKAWVWYRKKLGIPMKNWGNFNVKLGNDTLNKWIADGLLFVEPETLSLVPYPVFLYGNLYTKITYLKKNEAKIVEKYGQEVYDSHFKMLEDNKPEMLSIQSPVESKRPVILAISQFAKDFMISELRLESGVELTQTMSLQLAFRDWLRQYPRVNIKENITPLEIIRIYLNNKNKPKGEDEEVWRTKKNLSKVVGERLFKEFLHEALTYEDQVKIDVSYNEKFNAIVPLKYHKVPIGLEISKQFGDYELQLKPEQREGVAFMELNGSGILGYDVGVGKTMTAIAEVASAIKNGKCKRPLIVVPNSTYENWISEMGGKDGKPGILTGTGIEINKFFNLGVNNTVDYDEVKDGSITLLAYSGFKLLGFKVTDQMAELHSILDQDDITNATEKRQAKFNEKLEGIIGEVLSGTKYDIDDFGFDYICVDEAHNFKNVFGKVKADDQDGKQFEISGGESTQAKQMFFITNYIQRNYGRNVMLLTATPFTNSPLEIYSMLSFVSYEYMRENGILNVKDFFETFVSEQDEWVSKQSGVIKKEPVVKRYNNILALQKLINSHINFKDGKDVPGLVRPCKVNIPKLSKEDKSANSLVPDDLSSFLAMTETQKENQDAINFEAKKGGSKTDPGRLLRLLNYSMDNALSPYLFDKQEPPESYVDYVEESPKIYYTLMCIDSVKKWHEKDNSPMSGQVIYMNRGKEFFPLIKEYLIKELGFKERVKFRGGKISEIELLQSGMGVEKKERITDAFNSGVTKVVIGTSTIKEGINLQKNATCVYNLFPDWNPTDLRQIEGRIHRQKNPFGYVRSIMPLIENSMDVFIFQKLEEKTSRINQIWQSDGSKDNVLDEESLDPKAIKYALITDEQVLIDFEVKLEKEDLSKEIALLEANILELENFGSVKREYDRAKEGILRDCKGANVYGTILFDDKDRNPIRYPDVKDSKRKKFTKEQQAIIKRQEKFINLQSEIEQNDFDDKKLIRFHRQFYENAYFKRSELDSFKQVAAKFNKLLRFADKTGGNIDEAEIEEMITEARNKYKNLQERFENITSEENIEKIREQVKEKRKEFKKEGGSIEDRVDDFMSINKLLKYKIQDVKESCDNPKELAAKKPKKADKEKKIKIAKAKAKALRIRKRKLRTKNID